MPPRQKPEQSKTMSWHRQLLGQDGSPLVSRRCQTVELPGLRAEARRYAATVRRRRPDKVAFVLAGGGALGAGQVGALRALVERGIRPDLLVGVSVGALNAAAFAQHPTVEGAAVLEQAWADAAQLISHRDRRLVELARFATRRPSVYDSSGLSQVIAQTVHFARLEQAPVPVGVVATALSGDPERCFWQGDAGRLLLASCSLPGIFPPVVVDETTFIDGGVTNNVPVSHAVAAGATRLYVLLCTPRLQEVGPFGPRPFDQVLKAFAVARQARAVHDLNQLPDDVEATVIPGPAVEHVFYTDLHHSAAFTAEGYKTAAAALDLLDGPPGVVPRRLHLLHRRVFAAAPAPG